jgi:hypothetical protein
VTLDGRRSKGKNLKYEWTFEPADGCPAGTDLSKAKKEGVSPSVKLLCSTKVKLRVNDGVRQDEKTTVVSVKPRDGKEWTTEVSHKPRWDIDPGWPEPSARRTGERGPGGTETVTTYVKLGENRCAEDHQPPTETGGILHPHKIASGSTWRDVGFTLERLEDADGPFDTWWYVSESSLAVPREAVFNQHVKEGTRFYEGNVSRKINMVAWLKNTEKHEGEGFGVARSGHTQALRELIRDRADEYDPRRGAEKVFGRDEKDVEKRVNDLLSRIDQALINATSDPLEGDKLPKYFLPVEGTKDDWVPVEEEGPVPDKGS